MEPGYYISLSNQFTPSVWVARIVPAERVSTDEFQTVGKLPIGYWERATLGIKNMKGEHIPLFYNSLFRSTGEEDCVTYTIHWEKP